MPHFEPLGDRTIRASFADEADAAAWAEAVRGADLPGVADVVLAYRTVAVVADPERIGDWGAWTLRLTSIWVPSPGIVRPQGHLVRVPTWYGGADLNDVADELSLTESEVVALHSGVDYRVFAVGFQPGFPYAGYLPGDLSGLARRSSPRPRVPAGSVAIAGRQTGIYPTDSPGGWHLLGITPCRVADPASGAFPVEPGDLLRFEPIARAEFDRLRALEPPPLLRAGPFAPRDSV